MEFKLLNDEERKEMKSPRVKLILPILAIRYAGRHYTLDTDACDIYVDCMLLHVQPDKTKEPIGYWSRSRTKAEKGYCRTLREFLTIVWPIVLPRSHFAGSRFTIQKDRGSLRWILNLANTRRHNGGSAY